MLNISQRPIPVAAPFFLGVVSGLLYALKPTMSAAKPINLEKRAFGGSVSLAILFKSPYP
jgi:hypothetical protein